MEHSGGLYKLVVSKNRTLIWIVFLVPEIEEKSSKVKHRPFGNKSTFEGGTKKNCYTVLSRLYKYTIPSLHVLSSVYLPTKLK